MLLVVFYSRAYSLQDDNIVPFRDSKKERLQYFIGPNPFSGLSVFIYALLGQHASYEVFRSLKEPSYSNWKTVSNISVASAALLTSVMVVSAWLNLGDAIEANILATFQLTDTATLVAKVLLAITMNLTYPMELFVARQNFNRWLGVDFLGWEEYMPVLRFFLITSGAWVVSCTIGKCTGSVRHFLVSVG